MSPKRASSSEEDNIQHPHISNFITSQCPLGDLSPQARSAHEGCEGGGGAQAIAPSANAQKRTHGNPRPHPRQQQQQQHPSLRPHWPKTPGQGVPKTTTMRLAARAACVARVVSRKVKHRLGVLLPRNRMPLLEPSGCKSSGSSSAPAWTAAEASHALLGWSLNC